MITSRNLDDSLAGKDAVFRRPANGGEPAAAEWAARLLLRPLHNAEKAEVVVAAIDFASDHFATFQEANWASLRR